MSFGLRRTVSRMQLVQIGEVRPKTIQELFYELADRQQYEIARLKRSALERVERKRKLERKARCRKQEP